MVDPDGIEGWNGTRCWRLVRRMSCLVTVIAEGKAEYARACLNWRWGDVAYISKRLTRCNGKEDGRSKGRRSKWIAHLKILQQMGCSTGGRASNHGSISASRRKPMRPYILDE